MEESTILGLPLLTAGQLLAGDMIVVVDVSDPSESPEGTTKRYDAEDILAGLVTGNYSFNDNELLLDIDDLGTPKAILKPNVAKDGFVFSYGYYSIEVNNGKVIIKGGQVAGAEVELTESQITLKQGVDGAQITVTNSSIIVNAGDGGDVTINAGTAGDINVVGGMGADINLTPQLGGYIKTFNLPTTSPPAESAIWADGVFLKTVPPE